MIKIETPLKSIAVAMLIVLLIGCKASGNRRAPIEERETASKKTQPSGKKSPQQDSEIRPQFYLVQKGDTLYSISFEHGLDYREVATQNNIENPAAIQIGQQIKLAVTTDDLAENKRTDAKLPAVATSSVTIKKDYPRVLKLPYSDQAASQIEQMQYEKVQSATKPIAPIPINKQVPESDTGSDEAIEWVIPTKGKVIAEYSESANRKGVDISGSKGQMVNASAAGKVVYSGSGLRGYGKLVIIKHNKTFLSAYAHNELILVKEGDSVHKGQKIAEMGSTDADQVKLHFEIRKFGKPVDPSKYLNFFKS